MATYRTRGNKIRAEVCINGSRESATFPTKTQAKEWAESRSSFLRLTGEQRAADFILLDVFNEYVKRVSPTKRGERWEVIRFNLLSRYSISKIKLKELNESHVADWRDHRLTQVAPATVHREMCLMSHACEKARKEWRWISRNPFKDVDRPKKPPHRERLFAPGEVERLCKALGWKDGQLVNTISQRVAVAMLFAIETAMRRGEVCGLTERLIDRKKRVAHLPKTKNGLARSVPLSSRAIELLSYLPAAGWPTAKLFNIHPDSLSSLFRRACIKTNIDDLTFHDCRHEAITRLAKIYNPLELARVVGHTDLKTLMVYYNETAEQLAKKLL